MRFILFSRFAFRFFLRVLRALKETFLPDLVLKVTRVGSLIVSNAAELRFSFVMVAF